MVQFGTNCSGVTEKSFLIHFVCLGQLCSSITMAETSSETVSEGHGILPTVRNMVCAKKFFLILSWNVKCPLYCPWNVKRPLYFPWNVIRTPPLPPSEKALILRIFVVSLTGLARLTQIVLTDKLADWSGTSWLHFSETLRATIFKLSRRETVSLILAAEKA